MKACVPTLTKSDVSLIKHNHTINNQMELLKNYQDGKMGV